MGGDRSQQPDRVMTQPAPVSLVSSSSSFSSFDQYIIINWIFLLINTIVSCIVHFLLLIFCLSLVNYVKEKLLRKLADDHLDPCFLIQLKVGNLEFRVDVIKSNRQ